ncbi:MAG: peptidoglycan DD-metalloendopeptidase family protein [Dorea sp.]|nr:peptidoglycan DD-metalloendopeptidase family protein [Dorea sp.]
MRGKKLVSLLLVGMLCSGMVFTSEASSASEAKKEAEEAKEKAEEAKEKSEELEEQKEQAETEKQALAAQLDALLTEITDIEDKIFNKQEEISLKEDELIQARVDENDQYESMKKRIKYMYENGNGQFVEILFEAKDLSDFLNKTEYISSISDYDRDMLKKYQQIVKDVEAQEAALQQEQEEMEAMQDELIAKQGSLESLLATKELEIGGLKEEIDSNAERVKKLEAAAKAAADAARKKAEAEAAAKEAAAREAAAKKNAAVSEAGSGEIVVSGNGTFTHPCPGYTRISSQFGYRTAPLRGASTNHKGTDFAAPTGTPIYAAAGGTVTSARYSGSAGNMIVINHGGGLQTYYMHCSRIFVSAGTKVAKGQHIGAVGTTGNSTGPHLHFQVMSGGVPVNAMNYL